MRLNAYAKLNLSLDILGERTDGYHELAMVMQSVSLCDTVEVELCGGGLSLSCGSDVPGDERNTAVKAAQVFFAALEREPDARIHLEKHIPQQAGMGGGSADAAAVLTALNTLCGAPFNKEKLRELGLLVGADVPFCLFGGTALAQGIGELLLPLPPLPECFLAVCKPPVNVSTAQAYRLADSRKIRACGHTQRVIEALENAKLSSAALSEIGAVLGNDFEELLNLPEVESARRAMLAGGALGARMTGSGSAVFGIFQHEDDAHLCVEALYQYGEAFLCRPVKIGVETL